MIGRRHLTLSLVVAAVVWSTRALAQEAAADRSTARADGAEAATEVPTAPVAVDGVTLFRVRGISALPAERRAAAIADRIRAVAADRAIPAESLTVRDSPLGSFVVVAGRRLFAVSEADAAVEGVSRHVLAAVYRDRVAQAILTFRSDREPAVLWRSAGMAALATAAFVLAIAVGRRLMRRVHAMVDRRYRARIRDVEFHSIEILRGERLWREIERGLGLVATLAALAVGYVYVDYVLLLFPWTRAIGQSLADMLLQPLAVLGAGLLRFLPDLFFLAILALVTRFALKLVGLLFRGIANGSITLHAFEPEWAQATERMARIAVVVVALIIAYPYIPGSGSEAFKGIGLAIGLMFSLGSPSVIGNLVAGLTLAFRRAFRVGDRVRIGDFVGDVAQVRMLTTYLRSPKNEQIVIPNSLILNSEVVNYSTLAREKGLILHSRVRLGYGTPWRQVEALLLQAARRTAGILPEPEPFVHQRSLGEFAVEYEINAYCDEPNRMIALYSALHRNILDEFNEYGVQIMVPSYESDPERPKVVPRDRWFVAPAKPVIVERAVDAASPATPGDLVAPAGRVDGGSPALPGS